MNEHEEKRENIRYSSHSDMMLTELHELMEDAPNDEIRAKYDRFIKELKASM